MKEDIKQKLLNFGFNIKAKYYVIFFHQMF